MNLFIAFLLTVATGLALIGIIAVACYFLASKLDESTANRDSDS